MQTPSPVRHLAIIPDGNRRWARAHGLSAQEGHRAGIAAIDAALRAAFDSGAECVTFWWGSPANLQKRDAEEVRGILSALSDWLTGAAPALLREYDARFSAYGRIDELCPSLASPLAAARAAAGTGPRRVVLLMAYDGRDEIRAAVARLTRGEVQTLEDGLWTADLPDVDLLIRSGDSAHLSAGFMIWRISEARLCFVPELWPAVGPDQVRALMASAGASARRYGA